MNLHNIWAALDEIVERSILTEYSKQKVRAALDITIGAYSIERTYPRKAPGLTESEIATYRQAIYLAERLMRGT